MSKGFEIGPPTTEIRGVSKSPRTLNNPVLYEDIVLEGESKAKERESVLCMGRHSIGHLFSGVNF